MDKVYCNQCKYLKYPFWLDESFGECSARKRVVHTLMRSYTYNRECYEFNKDNNCAMFKPNMATKIRKFFKSMFK